MMLFRRGQPQQDNEYEIRTKNGIRVPVWRWRSFTLRLGAAHEARFAGDVVEVLKRKSLLGRPLTASKGGKPNLAPQCEHQNLLPRGNGKMYWWTCASCGMRWERAAPLSVPLAVTASQAAAPAAATEGDMGDHGYYHAETSSTWNESKGGKGAGWRGVDLHGYEYEIKGSSVSDSKGGKGFKSTASWHDDPVELGGFYEECEVNGWSGLKGGKSGASSQSSWGYDLLDLGEYYEVKGKGGKGSSKSKY